VQIFLYYRRLQALTITISADIDAPTFPEGYVEKVSYFHFTSVDNMSAKLTRRVKIGNENIVLTGMPAKSEIAFKTNLAKRWIIR